MLSIPNTFTPERRELFFQVLEDTCSPKQAAAAAGISRQTAFYHKANDIEFCTRWEKAIEVALDALLDEAYRRAAIGYDEPVGHPPGTTRHHRRPDDRRGTAADGAQAQRQAPGGPPEVPLRRADGG